MGGGFFRAARREEVSSTIRSCMSLLSMQSANVACVQPACVLPVPLYQAYHLAALDQRRFFIMLHPMQRLGCSKSGECGHDRRGRQEQQGEAGQKCRQQGRQHCPLHLRAAGTQRGPALEQPP